MARKTRKISFVTPHSQLRVCVICVYYLPNYFFRLFLKRFYWSCVLFPLRVCKGLDQVCWVIKYLRSKLPLAKPAEVEESGKRGEGESQGSTTTIAVGGSDREFVVVEGLQRRKNYPIMAWMVAQSEWNRDKTVTTTTTTSTMCVCTLNRAEIA